MNDVEDLTSRLDQVSHVTHKKVFRADFYYLLKEKMLEVFNLLFFPAGESVPKKELSIGDKASYVYDELGPDGFVVYKSVLDVFSALKKQGDITIPVAADFDAFQEWMGTEIKGEDTKRSTEVLVHSRFADLLLYAHVLEEKQVVCERAGVETVGILLEVEGKVISPYHSLNPLKYVYATIVLNKQEQDKENLYPAVTLWGPSNPFVVAKDCEEQSPFITDHKNYELEYLFSRDFGNRTIILSPELLPAYPHMYGKEYITGEEK